MSVPNETYVLGETYRPDYYTPFPIGWVIFSVILIILIIAILYFFFRQRTQLIEPNRCPTVKSQYAVQPGITKTILRTCGQNQSSECQFPAATLSQAIDLCDTNSSFCNEFSYDPLTQTVRIVDPNGSRQSTQQENLYLRQIGVVTVSPDSNIVTPTLVTPNSIS